MKNWLGLLHFGLSKAVKKMSEQRLIDANAVEVGFEELCQSPYFKNDVNAKNGAETLMDLCVRTDSHKPNTIDPETLPIVRQLRDDLARVTAERDAAVECIATNCRYIEDTERGPYCVLDDEPCCRCEGVWRVPQKEEP